MTEIYVSFFTSDNGGSMFSGTSEVIDKVFDNKEKAMKYCNQMYIETRIEYYWRAYKLE